MVKKISLTGDRPTGRLHLGHYIGSLKSRLAIQHNFDQYIMVADVQALTDYFDNPQRIAGSIREVVADYLAVGIDPELSTIFIQSGIPALSEMTMYFMNMVSVARVERNPTVKTELAQKGFVGESVPLGFFCYPISQVSDIVAFKADIVPVGEDQLPMIELTNEVVRRFNRTYNTQCLKEATAQVGKTGRLVGIDGKAKASKSLNNAIFLADSAEMVKEKVMAMYTDPDHIKVSDPGKIEGNVVFAYLDAFYEDKDEIASLKSQYRKGGLGDMVLKHLLNDTLQKILEPIREKRASIDQSYIEEVCMSGTKKANSVAGNTLNEIKNAIGINFFRKWHNAL